MLNEWGLTLIGVALVLGIATRLASWLGFVMMILYYFPILDFPYPNAHSFLVDEHLMYAALFLVLAAFRAGRAWGFDAWCARLSICAKYPKLHDFLS